MARNMTDKQLEEITAAVVYDCVKAGSGNPDPEYFDNPVRQQRVREVEDSLIARYRDRSNRQKAT
jgi:hypothetical protein